jgi:hypothetical protein
MHEVVIFIDQCHLRCDWQVGELESHYDQLVALVNRSGCASVDADRPRTRFPSDNVGLEAGSIVDICDQDLLSWPDIDLLQEIIIYGYAPDVFRVSVRYHGTMDLSAKQASHFNNAYPDRSRIFL